MDRFKIGDKVYSKEGYSGGKEIGTVCKLDGEKVSVRLFHNLEIVEFWPTEIMNESESKQQFNEWQSSLPRNKFQDNDPYE